MKAQAIKLGSKWKASDGRIFELIEKRPFGMATIKQEGRYYFGEIRQRDLKSNFTPQST